MSSAPNPPGALSDSPAPAHDAPTIHVAPAASLKLARGLAHPTHHTRADAAGLARGADMGDTEPASTPAKSRSRSPESTRSEAPRTIWPLIGLTLDVGVAAFVLLRRSSRA